MNIIDHANDDDVDYTPMSLFEHPTGHPIHVEQIQKQQPRCPYCGGVGCNCGEDLD